MSPWTLLGWLLVGVFCLLLVGGLYLVGVFWGWPAWIAPLVGGCCLALPLSAATGAALSRRRSKEETRDAPAALPDAATPPIPGIGFRPVSRNTVPCLLLVGMGDIGGLLASVLDDAERVPLLSPLYPSEPSPLTLWTTDRLRWLTAVLPQLHAEPAAPSPEKHILPPATGPDESSLLQPPHVPERGWNALLNWNADHAAQLLGSPIRGIVLVLPTSFLAMDTCPRGMAEYLRHRLQELSVCFGALPVWLLWTGLEKLPGVCRLSRNLKKMASTGHDPLREPLGWRMPLRSAGPDAALRITDAIQQGVDGVVRTLDDFVRAAEAGQEFEYAPGAFVFGRSLECLTAALSGFAADLSRNDGPDLRGIFWIGLPMEDIKNAGRTTGGPLFAERLLRDLLPEYIRTEGRAGRRLKRKTAIPLIAAGVVTAILTGATACFLQESAHQSRLALLDMKRLSRFENAEREGVPTTHDPATLYHMAREVQRLDRACSGAAHLYSAPSDTWAQLRPAVVLRISSALPSSNGKTEDDFSEQGNISAPWLTALMDWAATRPGVAPLLFRDPGGAKLAEVSGAASAAGRRAAHHFFDTLEAVLPPADRRRVSLLRQDYDTRVLSVWYASGVHLLRAVYAVLPDQPLGAAPELPEGRARSLTAPDMLGPDNPCNAFLEAALRELRPAMVSGDVTTWVTALQEIGRVRTLLRLPAIQSAGDWKYISTVEGIPEGPRDTLARAENLLRARTAWADYTATLTALRPEAGSSQGLVRLARALYAGAPASEGPSLGAAADAWRDLKERLAVLHPALNGGKGALWFELLRSPLQFVTDAAVLRAAQDLQFRWTTEVITPAEGLEGESLHQRLSGRNGLLRAFAEGPATPFLCPSGEGLTASTAMGRRFPLSAAFLRCLNETSQKSILHPASFPVRVHLLPVTVNAGATVHPRGVTLRMDCGKEPLRAVAYNYPESLTVDWTPEQCGDLKLSIHFDDFTVSAVFEHPLGFARFASLASRGALTYHPADFPRYRHMLETLGVTRIRIGFRVEGADALLPLLQEATPPLPRFILQTREIP